MEQTRLGKPNLRRNYRLPKALCRGLRLKMNEKELRKKEGKFSELEIQLADVINKGMYWESLVMVAN